MDVDVLSTDEDNVDTALPDHQIESQDREPCNHGQSDPRIPEKGINLVVHKPPGYSTTKAGSIIPYRVQCHIVLEVAANA